MLSNFYPPFHIQSKLSQYECGTCKTLKTLDLFHLFTNLIVLSTGCQLNAHTSEADSTSDVGALHEHWESRNMSFPSNSFLNTFFSSVVQRENAAFLKHIAEKLSILGNTS